MSLIITIDPGINGGIAYKFEKEVCAIKMPVTLRDIFDMFDVLVKRVSGCADILCYLEKTGTYQPGNSGPGAVKFSRHCGNLEAFLIALRIPYHEILPAKWQKHLIGAPNYPKIPKETKTKERKRILAKRKTERKNKIKQTVQAKYPHLKITLATSDALGILCFVIDSTDDKLLGK